MLHTPTVAEAYAIPKAVAAGVPVTPVAPAMADVFDVARATVAKATIAVPTIAEAAIAMNAVAAPIARVSESRCGAAGKQQSARNDRGSQKALHGFVSSVVLSGPGRSSG
jgi:hypothetical protein